MPCIKGGCFLSTVKDDRLSRSDGVVALSISLKNAITTELLVIASNNMICIPNQVVSPVVCTFAEELCAGVVFLTVVDAAKVCQEN